MTCAEILATLPSCAKARTLALGYIGDRFLVHADLALLSAVSARLAPYVNLAESGEPTATVRAVLASASPLADVVRRAGRRLVVDASLYPQTRSDGWRLDLDDGWLIVIERTRTLCVFAPSQGVVALVSPSEEHLLCDAQRVLKSLIGLHAERRGFLMVHASGVATARGAVLFMGDSRNGKTTTLLHGLTGFRADLLSCDTSVMRLEGSELVARGWPSSFSLSVGTLHDFPSLHALMDPRHAELAYEEAWALHPKHVLETEDVVTATGSRFRAEAAVRAIVALRFDPRAPTGIERIDDADELQRALDQVCLGSRDPLYPNWHGWWKTSPAQVEATLRALAQGAIERGVEFHRMTWAPGPETLLRRVAVLEQASAAKPRPARSR